MKNYIWKLFLLLYLGVLVVHVFELGFSNIQVIAFLLIGLALAIFSHRTNHVISLLFLVAHMTIEAIEYATGGLSFSTSAIVWVLIHIAMDGVFLWGEVKRHFFQVRWQMYSTITLGIICVYVFIPKAQTIVQTVEAHQSSFEFLVLGGVIGCVLSHILPHYHKG